jgi:hypothetical protein
MFALFHHRVNCNQRLMIRNPGIIQIPAAHLFPRMSHSLKEIKNYLTDRLKEKINRAEKKALQQGFYFLLQESFVRRS